VAEAVCDSIAVMYLGKIVEMGDPTEILKTPRHPYSRALVLSTPIADPTKKRMRLVLPGEVPSPSNPPAACRFNRAVTVLPTSAVTQNHRWRRKMIRAW